MSQTSSCFVTKTSLSVSFWFPLPLFVNKGLTVGQKSFDLRAPSTPFYKIRLYRFTFKFSDIVSLGFGIYQWRSTTNINNINPAFPVKYIDDRHIYRFM